MAGCSDGSIELCGRLWRTEAKGKFSKLLPKLCTSVKLLVPLLLIFILSGATRKAGEPGLGDGGGGACMGNAVGTEELQP